MASSQAESSTTRPGTTRSGTIYIGTEAGEPEPFETRSNHPRSGKASTTGEETEEQPEDGPESEEEEEEQGVFGDDEEEQDYGEAMEEARVERRRRQKENEEMRNQWKLLTQTIREETVLLAKQADDIEAKKLTIQKAVKENQERLKDIEERYGPIENIHPGLILEPKRPKKSRKRDKGKGKEVPKKPDKSDNEPDDQQ